MNGDAVISLCCHLIALRQDRWYVVVPVKALSGLLSSFSPILRVTGRPSLPQQFW